MGLGGGGGVKHPNGNAKVSFFNPFLPIWGEEWEWEWEEEEEESRHPNSNAKVSFFNPFLTCLGRGGEVGGREGGVKTSQWQC